MRCHPYVTCHNECFKSLTQGYVRQMTPRVQRALRFYECDESSDSSLLQFDRVIAQQIWIAIR